MHYPNFLLKLTSTPRRALLAKLVLLVGLVWAVYSNSLRNPFHFDDWHVISSNPAIKDLGNIPSFFADPAAFSVLEHNRGYRPLFLTSMALCWGFADGDTLPFHLVSLALHTGCALLFFFIVRRLSTSAGFALDADASFRNDWMAALAAGVFALHPLNSQPVNYISSQSVLITGFFYLLAFHLFLSVYHTGQPPRTVSKWLRLTASYLCLFLALFSKPIAVTLPLNLLSWELLLGRMAAPEQTPDLSIWRRLLSLGRGYAFRFAKHIPYLVVCAAYVLIRMSVLPAALGAKARTTFVHFVTQTTAIVVYYLKRTILPLGLNADPDFPDVTDPLEPSVIFSVLVLATIGLLLWLLRRHRTVLFWAFWYPICLLVTTYLVQLGQNVNEHRTYLALGGFGALIGLAGLRLAAGVSNDTFEFRMGPRGGARFAGLCGLLILMIYIPLTRRANKIWSSDIALWENAALNGGTWRAHMNYALALDRHGRPDEALPEYQESVRLGGYAWSHMNLGLAYVKRNQQSLGMTHLRQAVQLWPQLPEARFYLAYGYQREGKLDKAAEELREAVRLRPNYVAAVRDLARLYERLGRPADAVVAYERLLRLEPGSPGVAGRIRQLGKIDPVDRAASLYEQGNLEAALSLLETAYETDAADKRLLFGLAFYYQQSGDRDSAVRIYEELLRIAPPSRQGVFNLAYAYMQGPSKADWTRAAALFRQVLEIDPSYTEVLYHLGTVHRKLGDAAEAIRYDRRYLEQGTHEGLKREARKRLDEAER